MEMLMENGQVLQILFDKSSIEIASVKMHKNSFNERMKDRHICIGMITMTENVDEIIDYDFSQNMIDPLWVKSRYNETTKIIRYYSYITSRFSLDHYEASFKSMLLRFLYNNRYEIEPIVMNGLFNCVLIVKL